MLFLYNVCIADQDQNQVRDHGVILGLNRPTHVLTVVHVEVILALGKVVRDRDQIVQNQKKVDLSLDPSPDRNLDQNHGLDLKVHHPLENILLLFRVTVR